jgi:uncharacterized protein YjlB
VSKRDHVLIELK